MKILKHGKLKTRERRFICQNCGCEFTCKREESSLVSNGIVVTYVPLCPECGVDLPIAWKCGEEYKED